ncbi:hypothetical protein LEP1GSC199_1289 [Leptospira vanthielii serovar Holland str. Waz Holland = ATCC 700522]|uniref:Uncharacterized protein n=1 Tax=Leptospira vanthielii serovar Holland str. Waz Holland = ATCC 700522 TaxID=1218591 RepID=N1W9L9_9LEPT|nr:hypothetical protein LEP1GSC199_1289 [Leptospira vanthielii serovar Holland str. Waz Holland = ATCC 700522]
MGGGLIVKSGTHCFRQHGVQIENQFFRLDWGEWLCFFTELVS